MDSVRVDRRGAAQRWLLVPLSLVFAVALQSALFSDLTLFGARPELALLVALAVAFDEGPEWGAVAGFVAGLLIDLIGVLPLGLSALSFTIVCYVAGFVGRNRFDHQIQLIGLAGAATIAAQLIVLALALLIGQGTRGVSAAQILFTGVYNTALATLIVPGMHKLLKLGS